MLLAGSYSSRRSVFLLYVILAFLALLVGFRAETVGVDTETYQLMYISLGEYGYEGYPEPIYGVLCELFNRMGVPFSLFQTMLMYIALCVTASAIRRESNNYCLSMFLMISMYFICYAMNIFRQVMACLIVVNAFSVLINSHKKWHFVFWIFVAAGFHLISLMMLSALIFDRIRLNKIIIYSGFVLTLFVGLISILDLLVPLLGDYGTLYIESQGDDYTKNGMRLVTAFFMSVYWTIGFVFLYENADEEFRESLYMKLFFMGILLFNVLIRHDLGLRITLFFIFPLIIGLPVFVDKAKMNRLKAQALVVSYTSIYYFLFLAINSANVVPYEITQD